MIRQFGPTEAWFIIAAVRWTLLLSAIAFIGGGIAGLGVALARTAPVAGLRLAATGYIQLFQGTPLLMQLFLVFSAPPCWAAARSAGRRGDRAR
jgi:polar amino acid transport system permease protein